MLRNRFTRLLMWMGLAAVATYLLDPERGEQRRRDLRKQVDQLRKKGKELGKKANLAWRRRVATPRMRLRGPTR